MIPRLLLPAYAALTFGFRPLYWIQAAVAVAGLAMSAASSSASKKAGKEAAEAQKEAWEIETQLKLGAVQAQTESIVASKQEDYDATVSRMSEITRQAMMTRGRIAAGMGEAGVAGNTVSRIFMSSFFEEARARGQEIYNLDKKNKQANRDIRGVQSGLQLGTKPAGYNTTGDNLKFASNALQIVGNYASAYSAANSGSQAANGGGVVIP